MAQIALRNLQKKYGQLTVVDSINLDIAHNEFVVLVGPSGCGKSTTLRMIAGLEEISGGEVVIGERVVNDLAAKDRDIAMVFQNYALYPHLTVYENMSFGLRFRKIDKAEVDRRVQDAAKILGISSLLERRPKQLSGGQRQRVAMGRAIVRDPQAFLFDEPLSNLDAKLRSQMRTEIKRIHQRVQTTVIYVTHDQVEAMTLADRIVVMNAGHIEQVGTPQQMYDSPQTRFVASFIGSPSMNIVSCKLSDSADGSGGLSVVLSDEQSFPVPADRVDRYRPYLGRLMEFGIRPEHITERVPDGGRSNVDFTAIADVVEPMGSDTMVFFRLHSAELSARIKPASAQPVGSEIQLTMNMDHMHLIDTDTGRVV